MLYGNCEIICKFSNIAKTNIYRIFRKKKTTFIFALFTTSLLEHSMEKHNPKILILQKRPFIVAFHALIDKICFKIPGKNSSSFEFY